MHFSAIMLGNMNIFVPFPCHIMNIETGKKEHSSLPTPQSFFLPWQSRGLCPEKYTSHLDYLESFNAAAVTWIR